MEVEVRKTWLRSSEKKNKRRQEMRGDNAGEGRLGNMVLVSGLMCGK